MRLLTVFRDFHMAVDLRLEKAYNVYITNSNIKRLEMDNIILGLLLLQSRTIYQLRDRINKGMHLMYSSSMGSIQAALKKLLDCGYIDYEETIENGKYKKIYSVTDSGRDHFHVWVNGSIEARSVRNPELTKVYFMGMSERNGREANLEKYIIHLKEQYEALKLICEEAESISVPAEYEDIVFFQFAAARYGRDFMQFNIEWYEKLLDEVRNKSSEKTESTV